MSDVQDGGRHGRAGQTLVRATVAAFLSVALVSAGCSIGLTAASVGSPELADASVLISGVDAGGVGFRQKKTIAPTPAMDAGAAPDGAAQMSGSPQCGIPATGAGSCDPDEGSCSALDAGSGDAAGDAGSVALDGAPYPLADGGIGVEKVGKSACHVVALRGDAGAQTLAPACGAAGTGTSESVCKTASDCAPGFECVVDDHGVVPDSAATGVCRRYCCAHFCPNTDSYYCTMQATIGGSLAVPVCVPSPTASASDGGSDGGPACQLLDDTTCGGYGAGLTCQVVTQSGQVACVQPGTAAVGQSCATTNCAAGLSCIAGVVPYQTCAQLCNTESDDCPPGQTCMSNAALAGVAPQVGVCGP